MSEIEISASVREHLASLADKNDGVITPALVVDDARQDTSPLHNLFNWDVESAAYAHWIDRARTIIRSVRVVITNETTLIRRKVPVYVHDPDALPGKQGYVSLVRVASEKDRAKAVLIEEYQRAKWALSRAESVAEFLGYGEAHRALLDDVQRLRAEIAEG